MLEVFSELEEGDASHYAPALHLGLTEWRRIKEAFRPLLARPDHISCRVQLQPRSRRSPPWHRGPVSRIRMRRRSMPLQ
jgi:hypothetical protein